MDEPSEICYHGTDKMGRDNILKNGFNHVHNWFASTITAAKAVGGPYILAVRFPSTLIPVDEDGSRWQMCVHEYIPSCRISEI